MRSRVVLLAIATAVSLAACGSTVSPEARRAAQSGSEGLGGTEAAVGDAAGDAATGTDLTGAAGRAASGGTSAGGTARAQATIPGSVGGGSAVKGPIEIGIVRTGVSNAAAFGASVGNTITEASINDAIVAAMNEQGGLAGRRIVPVYDDTDTASSSWDADFEAACAKFTQDHKVVAVLGYVFDHVDAFEGCLAKRGIPHLSTTFNVPDTEVLNQYPTLFALATPRIERRSIAKIDGALATGVITKASKLGIVIDGCPGTKRAWNNKTKPYMESKGLTVVSTFEVGCARGSGDVGAEAGRAGNLVLQFRTAGVDTVAVMSVSESGPILILANAAEPQGWRPKYVVSSLASGSILAGQIPNEQAANVHGYGWLPVMDVPPDRWPAVPPAGQRCLKLAASKGLKLTAPADFAFALNICEALFVYEAALKATGGRTDGAAITAAVEALGANHPGAMTLDGRLTFGRDRHDAPSSARYFAWDRGCTCFTYRPHTFTIN
ncbi:MAG: hypothetical protein QOG87_1275 [Actinomycetota bacterium]|jgi:hypothetical protein